jgi:hypothetical protein
MAITVSHRHYYVIAVMVTERPLQGHSVIPSLLAPAQQERPVLV